MSSELARAVEVIVRKCLAVREGEDVLVVCDRSTRELAEALRDEAAAVGADAVLAFMEERKNDGVEPPAPLAAAMARADVVLAPTRRSLSHTAARREANELGARIATLPGIEVEVLARAMSADFDAVRDRSVAAASALDGAAESRITCPLGSDLRLDISGREGLPDTGELTEPGAFGNLPCGEGFISPLEGSAEGRLVVAGTIAGYGMPPEPAELTVEAGNLVAASGTAGEWLLDILSGAGEGGTNVAELGIGTNEKATLSESLLEAEKVLGTVHVAFGASAGIGGTVQVPIHLDCVVTDPTLMLDGEAVLRDGELLL